MDGRDRRKMGLQGIEPAGLDGGFIHEGAVEVGDLAGVGTGGRVGVCGLFDDSCGLSSALIVERAEDANADAIRGKLGAVDPGAVGVKVEVVARFDGKFHVGDGEAAGIGRGGGRRSGGLRAE